MFKKSIVALILFAVMTTKVKASMEPIPSIYVSCEDTLQGHFDCGKQIGETFSSRIAQSIDKAVFAKAAYEKIKSSKDSQLQQVFNNLKSYAIKTYPLYVEELKGTAVGSNQPFDLVLVMNFAQELALLTSEVIEPERCTDVFLPGMIAHNEDGMLEDLSTIYRVHMRTFDPKTGDSVDDFNGITYPARLPGWGPGYNAHICWTSNMLYPSVPASADGNGATTIFVSRDMARASSVDDAIKRCTPETLIAGQNQNFGDLRTGYMVTVETAPEGEYNVFNLTKSSDAHAVFHANEYLRLKNISQIQKKIVSSQHRRAVFQKKSNEIKDANTMLKFLGDTSDEQYPVYRHNDTTSEFTLLTVFIDLSKKQFSIYRGNPGNGGKSLLSQEFMLG